MTPLWTTATTPSPPTCGWALRSLAGPCVAQRVWLMPTQPGAGRSRRCCGQVGDAAGALAQVQVRPGQRGHAGAVVAAVFQAAQAFDEDRFRFPAADVADDAAHGPVPPPMTDRPTDTSVASWPSLPATLIALVQHSVQPVRAGSGSS